MGADAKAGSINTESLTAAQKEALLERLHNGQGNLTLQKWDDFLADLVDLGMITNSELEGYGMSGLSSQRAACGNIARIVRELLAGSHH